MKILNKHWALSKIGNKYVQWTIRLRLIIHIKMLKYWITYHFRHVNLVPKLWPSATKWGSLRGVSKLRKLLHCNEYYFLKKKNCYSTTFLSKGAGCWTSLYMVLLKITSQRFGLSKIVLCVCFYGSIKKKMFPNTSFLVDFHWKICLSWLCLVWWRFRKNT